MKRNRTETDLSPLGRWMRDNRHTTRTFAEKVREYRGLKVFSPRTVENWVYGDAVPRGDNMKAIMAITENAVTANSFVEAP